MLGSSTVSLGVHPVLGEVVYQGAAIGVLAQAAHHGAAGAHFCQGNGLVGPFAAGHIAVAVAKD